MPYKVNYKKIYDFLETRKGKIITASGIAYAIGVERIYPGTMAKLVREGLIEHCELKGWYKVQ